MSRWFVLHVVDTIWSRLRWEETATTQHYTTVCPADYYYKYYYQQLYNNYYFVVGTKAL